MNKSESPSALSPQQLALAYDRFVSARWRGEDEAADPVATWFEAHWVTQPPPEPDSPPAGSSILGAAGRGIRWYARGELLYGYVPGHHEGCYRVETAEAVPALIDPWQAAPSPRLATAGHVSPQHLDARRDRPDFVEGDTPEHRGAGKGDALSVAELAPRGMAMTDRVLSHTPIAVRSRAPGRR